MTPDFLSLPDRRLAYQQRRGRPDRPGVIFIGGYGSDMTGSKAEFLATRCATSDTSFLRFDCQGHGQSSGVFTDGTIGSWYDDAEKVFDQLTEGPQIVIGSSMGGWLACLLALKRSERVRALIGIATATDFTEELLKPQMTERQRAELARDGVMYMHGMPPSDPLPVTKRLLDEAAHHLLLGKSLPIRCPIRLLQGMQDTDIPWQHALKVAEQAESGDARVYLIKDGEHRLSRAGDLDLLWRTVEEFLV